MNIIIFSLILLIACCITFAFSYRHGYRKGALNVLDEWRKNNDEIKATLGSVLYEPEESADEA